MIKRKYGRIIGISGLAAKLTTPYGTLYNVTKIGIKAFMECLYEELFAMKLENQIRTVTAFPYYLATRQELMDLLEGNKLFFGVITPEEAADKIIVGMLEHKMDITIPSFLNQIAWIFR
jgi:short-subunit dehydrogenase